MYSFISLISSLFEWSLNWLRYFEWRLITIHIRLDSSQTGFDPSLFELDSNESKSSKLELELNLKECLAHQTPMSLNKFNSNRNNIILINTHQNDVIFGLDVVPSWVQSSARHYNWTWACRLFAWTISPQFLTNFHNDHHPSIFGPMDPHEDPLHTAQTN